ncbi:hypothetical protein FB45DRAFT_1033926 [Roridomyces roridus]|uniref:BTB domain-containing protein n=1 Tax=Roridomyces roridus TaxID=1738132 RepID=A0AAD7FE96_9AGAR|nr:hypothetical protein FB45DRAFT_1033926 [Roridomyces roridus]
MQAPTDSQHFLPVERDATFYHPSGDCILRVQQTLFKIHTHHLVSNSPVFASLFALPVGDTTVEGQSDDLPIVLHDDSADDFRSLFKYIYASVIATQITSVPASELPQVIAVARLAHKYDMEAWQNWAFLLIASHFKRSKHLSTTHIATIYKVCDKPQWSSLRTELAEHWIQRIESEPEPQSALTLTSALDAAEMQSDHVFLTRLYALHLTRSTRSGGTTPMATLANPIPFPTAGIPPVHLVRMLAAHWSLSSSWSNLRQNPPSFPIYTVYCTAEKHDACTRSVSASWEQALAAAEREFPSSVEMGARLERARRVIADLVPQWLCYDTYLGSGGEEPLSRCAETFKLQDHFFPPMIKVE